MQDRPAPGTAEEIADGITRVIADNPSPMTYWGTNSYLIGGREVMVFDPGPNLPGHLAALMAAIGGRRVTGIVVSHSHLDHSRLARPLAAATGAPVMAFGPTGAGRSAAMTRLLAGGYDGGGEGADTGFSPDIRLDDGARLDGDGWTAEVLHTPGHFGNHICLALGTTVLTGDLVMGWASSLVSPPEGDLTDFMASCRRLRARGPGLLLPGHGAPVPDGPARLDWLISHRLAREAAIRTALAAGPMTAAELTRAIYHDTAPALRPAAERNVLSHLIDLEGKGIVLPLASDASPSRYALA